MMWYVLFFHPILFTIFYFTSQGIGNNPRTASMYILKSQEVTFVERLDLFFLYIWMIWSIITIALFSFSALYVHRLHAKGIRKGIQLFCISYSFYYPFSCIKKHIEIFNDLSFICILFFIIVIPTIVIITNRRKKK